MKVIQLTRKKGCTLVTFEDNISLVADSALADTLGLFEGAEIALAEFKKINFDFAAKHAMQSALKTLARLSVTESQLRGKLIAKHVQYDAIDDAVQKLKALNYLNDERYAADFVTSARDMNKSRRETADTLKRRGVDAAVIEHALNGYSDAEETQTAAEYIAKQNALLTQYPPKMRAVKLNERAARRGFPRGAVAAAIETALAETTQEDYDAYFTKLINKKIARLKEPDEIRLRMRLCGEFIPMGARRELIDALVKECKNTEEV